ncbi:MAG: PAS domain S-box protein [Pirellulales bacterium]
MVLAILTAPKGLSFIEEVTPDSIPWSNGLRDGVYLTLIAVPIISWIFWHCRHRTKASTERSPDPAGRLSIAFFMSTLTTCAVVAIGTIAVRNSERSSASDSELINTAGRQRTLSEMIGRHIALHHERNHDPESPEHKKLAAMLERLQESRSQLDQRLSRTESGIRWLAPEIGKSLSEAAEAREQLILTTNCYLDAEQDFDRLDAQLQEKVDQFLPLMDRAVSHLAAAFVERRERGNRLATAVLIAAVLSMLLSYLLILYPAVGVLHDQYQNQNRLSAELQRLALVVQNTTNGVVITDARRRIVWANAAFTRITEYTLEEVKGRVPGEFLQCDETDPMVIQDMRAALVKRQSFDCELVNRSKTGRKYWLNLSIQPMHDDDGTLTGFIAIENDITVRKTTELELNKSLALQTAILNNSACAIVATSTDGIITLFNHAAEKMLGYSADEMVGLRTPAVYHDATEMEARALALSAELREPVGSGFDVFAAKAKRQMPEQQQWTYVRRDGSRFHGLLSVTTLHDSSGRTVGFLNMWTDITNLAKAHSDLRLERERLAEANRMAVDMQAKAEAANLAKSEFLANMSHEIRTPMTAILGYADLLTETCDAADPRQRMEYVNTIKRNGDHLLSILNDILDLSKIEAGKLRTESIPVQPNVLLHDTLSLMQVKAQSKNIRLETIFETAIPAVIQSDPVRIRQILVNLVGNAIKFTEQGSVTLRVRIDSLLTGSSVLRVDVTDTGIGMTAEQLGRLFGAFEQADAGTARKFGGTGLGLRISKRLAEMLGGDLSVTSKIDQGSSFCLTIPTGDLYDTSMLSPDELHVVDRSAEIPLQSSGAASLAGKHILLAEDGIDNQRLICFHLRKAGAEVTVAQNGREAIEKLTVDGTVGGPCQASCPFDLLLTDIQMPELDGYSTVRMLRGKGCTLPIVALTANAMSGDLEKCIAAGFNRYLSKPIDKLALLKTCEELTGNTPMPALSLTTETLTTDQMLLN